MKKNFTVNISGIIFNIDEDAYEKLNDYLDRIRSHFQGSGGRDEIIGDIEARIAEVLQQKTSETKKVVTIADIDEVIGTMGEPADFAGEDSADPGQEPKTEEKKSKRLYRDPDNKILAGISSGIAEYFRTDPIWIRLIFVVLAIFGGGSGIIIYILLWFIVPEARTTAEKLEMKGEKVNIKNIENSIKEEIDGLKDRLNNLKNGAGEYSRNWRKGRAPSTAFERFMDFLIQLFRYGVKAFVIVLGVFLIAFGLFMLFGMISFPLWKDANHMMNIPTDVELTLSQFFNLFFGSHGTYVIGLTGLIILFSIPTLFFIYSGIKILFKINYRNKLIGIGALSVWIIGLILTFYTFASIALEFSDDAELKKRAEIVQPENDLLYIQLNKDKLPEDEQEHYISAYDEYQITKVNDELMIMRSIELEFSKSNSKDYGMVIYKSARGKTQRQAAGHARAIQYNWSASDSAIILDPYSYVSEMEHWRNQEVEIVVKVPVGKTIFITEEVARLTTGNRHDFYGDMEPGYYIMTDKGLEEKDFAKEKAVLPEEQ